jgi:hypothetical protein
MVSVISTIHVIDFFKLSNPTWLAVSLAVAFEIGAAASLASLISLDKMNKAMVWGLFIILTLMQAMGNTYYAYTHLKDIQGWIELFGLAEEELIYQKRVLSIISGAVLPIVALGFIKSLVDYIKPEAPADTLVPETIQEEIAEDVSEEIVNPQNDTIIDLETSDVYDSFNDVSDDAPDEGYNEDIITAANRNRVPIVIDPTKL